MKGCVSNKARHKGFAALKSLVAHVMITHSKSAQAKAYREEGWEKRRRVHEVTLNKSKRVEEKAGPPSGGGGGGGGEGREDAFERVGRRVAGRHGARGDDGPRYRDRGAAERERRRRRRRREGWVRPGRASQRAQGGGERGRRETADARDAAARGSRRVETRVAADDGGGDGENGEG